MLYVLIIIIFVSGVRLNLVCTNNLNRSNHIFLALAIVYFSLFFHIRDFLFSSFYKKLLGFFLRLSIGLMMIQSGILVAKEMVGHANLVPNLVSLCLNNKVEFLWI